MSVLRELCFPDLRNATYAVLFSDVCQSCDRTNECIQIILFEVMRAMAVDNLAQVQLSLEAQHVQHFNTWLKHQRHVYAIFEVCSGLC